MGFDQYFDTRARKFAAFYRSEHVSRAIGRGALFDRLRYAVDAATSIGARHVVDVGCGSGPLFEPLASQGIRVTGLEPAAQMAELARAEATRFPGLVEVEARGWEEMQEHDAYDLAVALGVFDYVDSPADLLSRMSAAAPSVVASFPGPGLRTELRKIRYRRGGVAVHPYPQVRIEDLASACALQIDDYHLLGRAGAVVQFRRAHR